MAFTRKMLDGVAKLIADLKLSMLPSGTVCWFYLTEVPHGWKLCDGTNGTPNLIGRYPLGAISNIGQTVEAGLPNIKGTFCANTTGRGYASNGVAISKYYNTNMKYGGNDAWGIVYELDASRCDEIYGNSETVTPPSTKLLPCMKI